MSIHKRTLKDGTIEFRNDNGDLHYLDGPAVIYPNGDDEYWWHGKMQSKQDHDLNLIKLQQELSFIGNNTNKQNNNMNEQRKMIKESVSTKDWTRMLDLQLAGKDGSGIASTLKNKDKAIARYVAGTKLAGEDMKYNNGSFQQFYGSFSEFGDQALKLGATIQEIKDIFDNTDIPQQFVDKQKGASGKKLGSFVGRISKLVLDSGLDIEYQKYHGDALTNAGKDAMETNGRKWTIGYKADIIYNGKKYYFEFDAITDEGVDSTLVYYVLSHNSDKVFTKNFNTNNYDKMGVRDFLTKLKSALEEIKNSEPVVTEHKLYTSINEFKQYLNKTKMIKEDNDDKIVDKIYDILIKFDEMDDLHEYKDMTVEFVNDVYQVTYITQEDRYNEYENILVNMLRKYKKTNDIEISLFYINREEEPKISKFKMI